MANNMNKVIIQGNLTKDPECKEVGDTKVCKIVLASNREYKGEKDTCFIECEGWGGITMVIEQYLHTGKQVLIEGRLKLDTWKSKDGEARYKHVIAIENLQMLGAKE